MPATQIHLIHITIYKLSLAIYVSCNNVILLASKLFMNNFNFKIFYCNI